jgi:hypothetical protein
MYTNVRTILPGRRSLAECCRTLAHEETDLGLLQPAGFLPLGQ